MKTHPCARRAPQTHLLAPALGAAATLLAPGLVGAQPVPVPGSPYVVERVQEPYQGCPGVITHLSTGDAAGVKGEFDVNLPFPFHFYGEVYTTATVVGAGVVAFPAGQTVSITNTAPGTAAAPNALIAAWWEDIELLTGNNGFLGTSLTGTAPSRQLCVEWRNFNDEQVNDAFLTFKVVLHEGAAGRVDVVYGATAGATGSYSATMGLEDAAGARPVELRSPACSPSCQHADLVAMAGTRVTVTQDAGVELVAVGVSPPPFGFLGAAMNLPVQLGNLHGATVGPFQVEVRAADNPEMAGAVPVGSRALSLSPFQLLEVGVEVVPPASLGEGHVFFELLVDGAAEVPEVREDNNRVVSTTSTRMLPGGPDLAVTRVHVAQTAARAGDAVDGTVQVENRGSVPVAGGLVAVALSTNPAITGRDQRVADFAVQLAPGQAVSQTVSALVPAGFDSGAYYVGAVADPDQTLSELDESNNGRAFEPPLVVSGAQLGVTTTQLPAARLHVPYTAVLSAHGGTPPLAWRVASGQLPAGLGLVPSTGELYGRPAGLEVQDFTVAVTDAAGAEASAQLSLRVVDASEPLTIVTRALPVAVAGQEYAAQVEVTGGAAADPGLIFEVEGAPEGFAITMQGMLTGEPSAVGQHALVVTALAAGERARQALTLEIRDSTQLLIQPAALPAAQLGAPYRATLSARGGVTPYTWVLREGDLPPGLSLTAPGEVWGTPTAAGRFRFLVEVRDSGPLPALDLAALTLDVGEDGRFVVVTEALPDAQIGVGYDARVEAVGGLPPMRWRIREGHLPEGLFAQEDPSSGELRLLGQAEVTGLSTLLVVVEDAQGQRAQRALALRVVAPPSVGVEPAGGCRAGGAPSVAGWSALLGLGLWLRRRRRAPLEG
jgi:hypothetical protein